MSKFTLSIRQGLSLSLTTAIVLFGNLEAIAQSRFGRFPTPARAPQSLGQPRNGTVGGGVRSATTDQSLFCGEAIEGPAFTAFVPEEDSILYTTQDDPLLLVYIPELPDTSSGIAQLTVTDADGLSFGQSSLEVPPEGGLIGFTFPSELLPLADQTFYQWNLQLPCQDSISLEDPNIGGWVSFQGGAEDMNKSSLEMELEIIDELAQSGYWLDAVIKTTHLLEMADESEKQLEVIPRLETLLTQENLEDFVPYFTE